jgi:hypothetical protein
MAMSLHMADILARARGRARRAAMGLRKDRERRALARKVAGLQPDATRAVVVITGMSPGGLDGPGKVVASVFFPAFCATLARSGIRTCFATGPRELRSAVDRKLPTVIVNVYREVAYRIDHRDVVEIENQAAGVFNRSSIGPIVAEKAKTNQYLAARGIAMPSLTPHGRVFSNSRQASGAPVAVLDSLADADPSRYNTDFVDTRISYGGERYYSCVRLLCVGSRIVHSYVRARDVKEGSPSVHAKDTPLDAGLVMFLQRRLVEDRIAELAALAEKIAAALGPGFYAHDVLVGADGGAPLLCETGFKFHDTAYQNRLAPIAAELPVHRILFDVPALAEASARLFIAESERMELF